MKCTKCNGRGFIDNPRFYSYKTGCNDAYMHGIEPTKKCVTCNGSGYIVGNLKEIAERLLCAANGQTITPREAKNMYNAIMK
jgi:DnaJ-class molecular chaperone